MAGKKIKQVDDRFKKFGTVSFTAISKVNDFVDYLEQGEIRGTRCKGCGRAFFPPRADCHVCLRSEMEWFPVTGTGKLLTYSRLQYAPTGFTEDLPYCIAVVDFGEVKMFGRIAPGLPEEDLAVGMLMKAAVQPLPNGQIGYVFEKA